MEKTSRFAAVICMTGLTIALATSASATRFRGGGYLTDFQNCPITGWTGNEYVVARLHPAGLPNNDPDNTALSLVHGSGIMNMYGSVTSDGQWSTVTWTEVWSYAYTGTVDVRVTSFSANELTPTTSPVFLELEFRDFSGETGCTARFVGVVAPQQ